jgi:hypothetical protein
MFTNTTGGQNTAIGTSALFFNTTASENIAVGYQSAFSNTTGIRNTAVGVTALFTNTTGNTNDAFGYKALEKSTTASNNVALGAFSLQDNTTGTANAASGQAALNKNTTGSNNTAHGYFALYSNTTASNNTAVGYQAGFGITTGASNTVIGTSAGNALATGSFNVFVGQGAGLSSTGANGRNTFVGMNAGSEVTTGTKNTILGRFNGNEGGLDIRTGSNYVVLSDGDGNCPIFTGNGLNVALQGAGGPAGGTGIQFPATQNASSNANTLDDYEEGTWTPTFFGSGTPGTYTTTSVTATYTKVGRLVTARFDVSFSVASGGTESFMGGGLPFAYKDGAVLTGAGFAAELDTTASSSNGICLVNSSGVSSTEISLVLTRDNASLEGVAIGAVSTSTRLFFSFSYETP